MRFLGVDYGHSRTGLAVSDPLGVTCRPFGILAERDENRLVAVILATARDLGVSVIIVGIPRPLSGGVNEQSETVLNFLDHLRRDAQLDLEAQIAVNAWDERFTTALARRARSRRGHHDAVAACYLLQSYLDTLSGMSGGD